MSSRIIPPLLASYLSLPPEASLVLLTNVLGATSNWLLLRFLCGALLRQENVYGRGVGGGMSLGDSDVVADSQTKVVLVSFMRDWAFWKESARRLSLDLEKAAARKQFAFIDGLTGLFSMGPQSSAQKEGYQTLRSPELKKVSETIKSAVRELQTADQPEGSNKVLLVIDQLDLLLAATQIEAVELEEALMDLREQVHATVLTIAADEPLVQAQQTQLERDHSSFLLSLVHQADLVMGLRLLDTGTARDVSGVIRITVGDTLSQENYQETGWEERELLYLIGGDGGARVFERGQ